MRVTQAKALAAVVALGASTTLASAQGVPIIDANLLRQNLAILAEQERDLGRQQGRLARSDALLKIDAEIIAELDKLIEAGNLPVGATGDMIQTLEAGAGDPAASADSLYNPTGQADRGWQPAGGRDRRHDPDPGGWGRRSGGIG
ncbi:hypothetical protein [Paracoccus actinidiae]|uniref:hypothetical protein n=1 Tax=Paracoccus actinidiae TaxID=3064531 RepID=UPI0027D30115|nr:hypothetical protein [Paracoccus sp. M09]